MKYQKIDNKNEIKFTIASNTAQFRETDKSIEEIIYICKESGFAGIEGCPPLFSGKSLPELVEIGNLFKREGLTIQTFHLPYKDPVEDDISTLYETDRIKVENKMKIWIEKAAALGAEIGIVHPTSRKGYDVEIEGFDRIKCQSDKTIQAMLKFGEQYNFKIALENMLPSTGGRYGCNVDHMTELYKRNEHENLGFCMDTGHALVASGENAMEVYHALKDHLISFHLNDNGGDRDSHLAPGYGNFFWKEFFTELKKINFTNTVCIEAPPFSFGPDYSQDAWGKLFQETKKLAE